MLFDDLLKENVSLETLMDHKEFLNEVYMQNEELFVFLSKDENLQKMLNYLYFPNSKKLGHDKACKYSFSSFTAISDCEERLT